MIEDSIEAGPEDSRGAHGDLASFETLLRADPEEDGVVLVATGDERLAHSRDEAACRKHQQHHEHAATDGQDHSCRGSSEIACRVTEWKQLHDHTALKHCEISRRDTRQAGTMPASTPSASAMVMPITRMMGSEEISTFNPSMVML